MNTREAYIIMQEASGIEVGDTVKVLRVAKTHEMGWDNSWVSRMEPTIGEIFVVDCLCNGGEGIHNRGNDADYPFFVLEIVEKVVKRPTVKVGAKTYYEDEAIPQLQGIKEVDSDD